MAVRAVDVSEHNDTNDWTSVRGMRLAFARSGFGSDREDYKYKVNIAGIKRRSAKTAEALLSPCSGLQCIKPADYWYCYPSSANDGKVEGNRHCDVLDKYGIYDTHLIGVDVEEHGHLGKSDLATYISNHCAAVEDREQRRGVIYLGIPFVQTYLPSNWRVPSDWLTWVPWYGLEHKPTLADARRLLGGSPTEGVANLLERMLLWQYTNGLVGITPRSVSGIGKCDISLQTRGSEDDLIRYGCKR